MRTIGQIESEAKARRFSDFLFVQKIPNEIEAGDGDAWEIWVHSDDDLSKASQWLAAFRSNSDDQQFASAEKAAGLRAEKEKELKAFQQRVRTRNNLFRRFLTYQVGPLTSFLICACIFIAVWSKLGKDFEKVHWLFFSEFPFLIGFQDRLITSPEIRSGEIWRLVTPMFLHFTFLHILFNMLWLRDLGGMIEAVEGTGKFFALVIISAALSNYAQYVISGNPNFGGMSGVVYALLGYVWMKGKYTPGSGLFLHKEIVVMMIIWLVVCFTGWLDPVVGRIANWAHLGGLIVGVAWGFFETRRA